MVTGSSSKVSGIGGPQVRQGIALEVAPEHFYGVEFRRIGREEERMNSIGSPEKPGDALSPMCLGPIPHDDERLLKLAHEATQEAQDSIGRDVGLGIHGKVKSYPLPVRWKGQRSNHRDLPMAAPLVIEDGGLTTRRPGPSDQRSQKEAALVNEDDVGLQSAGFFLMSGQSTRTQRRMAFSSRSRARRSGFCGLHPMECRSRPI
jgi:hypothetical protein